MAGRQNRKWHKNFIDYMEFIVKHPNYASMPHLRKKDGVVRWVVTGKSQKGKDRLRWWNNKKKKSWNKKRWRLDF